MKKFLFTLLIAAFAATVSAQTAKKVVAVKKTTTGKTATKSAVQPLAITNTLDSASYAFGLGTASNMKQGGITALNYALLLQGFKDAFAGKTPLIDKAKSEVAINNLVNSLTRAKYSVQINEGKSFLENNKKLPGVQVTASGLQYQVLTKGTGVSPKVTDTVLVHYKGSLLNGKEFDSSYKSNQPISFPLNGVIPGWIEGVQLMQQGAKFKFFIPYQLAYGESGAGNNIPPFSTLVFEVELLKVTASK
ncbi:MAG: FKBP-type peptidyl-prolyl cis-trans isomerase [Pedobacter sp.]|nr:FKBP-type peptidyl-prolyl cis-trans isomerase [Pedobacter sp.]